jgi:hypothetical protein
VQNDLSVTEGSEAEALGFQFSANLPVVEDLTVEDDNHILVRAEQGLVAGREVKDA